MRHYMEGTTLHSLQPFDCRRYPSAVVGEVDVVMDRYPKIKCEYSDPAYLRMVGPWGRALGRCSFTVSKPVVKKRLWFLSALETKT